MGRRRPTALALSIAAMASVAMSCGARTGLPVPCVSPVVVDPIEIMLVVDRSASMGETNAEGETYWVALDRALRSVVPRLQGVAAVGMAFFPMGSTLDVACRASPMAALEPLGDLDRVMREFPAGPVMNGGTPTYEGLLAAATTLRARRAADPAKRRFVVLVTDGAAGCNDAHPLDRCVCLSPDDPDACRSSRLVGTSGCLDDERIVGLLRALHEEGIDTFVLGLSGAVRIPRLVPIYERFLGDMAVVGGRAVSGPRSYLSASNRAEIEASLARPLLEAGYCHLRRSDGRPLRDEALWSEGERVSRDGSHRDGWDWDDASRERLTLFGAACDRAIAQRVQRWNVTVEGRCSLD